MVKRVMEGEAIDYTPGEAIAAGDIVIQGRLIGISERAIAAGERGHLAIQGVFRFAKAASIVFTVGLLSYLNITSGEVTTSDSGTTLLGKCVKAAAADDRYVDILLCPWEPATGA